MQVVQATGLTAEYLELEDAVQNTTATLTLKHPATGRPTVATITLAGPEHPARKADEWARTRALRQEVEATGKYLFREPADIEQEEFNHLSACTLGWSGLAAGGVPMSFSADACRKLYADPRWAWVRDQVKAALDQRELFIGSSATA